MVWRVWTENSFISGSRLVPQSLHFENISGRLCQLYPSKASTVELRGRREARSGERGPARPAWATCRQHRRCTRCMGLATLPHRTRSECRSRLSLPSPPRASHPPASGSQPHPSPAPGMPARGTLCWPISRSTRRKRPSWRYLFYFGSALCAEKWCIAPAGAPGAARCASLTARTPAQLLHIGLPDRRSRAPRAASRTRQR